MLRAKNKDAPPSFSKKRLCLTDYIIRQHLDKSKLNNSDQGGSYKSNEMIHENEQVHILKVHVMQLKAHSAITHPAGQ